MPFYGYILVEGEKWLIEVDRLGTLRNTIVGNETRHTASKVTVATA